MRSSAAGRLRCARTVRSSGWEAIRRSSRRACATLAPARAEEQATALFVFIGASPHTGWLGGQVASDQDGFLLAGRDVDGEHLAAWGEERPLFLETSQPGVFAVGDVRSGSVKRVASAVGEGSMAVRLVHQRLATR